MRLTLRYPPARGACDGIRVALAVAGVGVREDTGTTSRALPGATGGTRFAGPVHPELLVEDGDDAPFLVSHAAPVLLWLQAAVLAPSVVLSPRHVAALTGWLSEAARLEAAVVHADWYLCAPELGPRSLACAKAAFAERHVASSLAAWEAGAAASATRSPACTASPRGAVHLVGSVLTVADLQVYSTLCFVDRTFGDLLSIASFATLHQLWAAFDAM